MERNGRKKGFSDVWILSFALAIMDLAPESDECGDWSGQFSCNEIENFGHVNTRMAILGMRERQVSNLNPVLNEIFSWLICSLQLQHG